MGYPICLQRPHYHIWSLICHSLQVPIQSIKPALSKNETGTTSPQVTLVIVILDCQNVKFPPGIISWKQADFVKSIFKFLNRLTPENQFPEERRHKKEKKKGI
eukprot:TRINITY_DN2197_c2_g1_i3.p3 TRINITY_DN2197_c2_g1~~TRINITY_DN2197_c2_g1_i3.p3  ORF type:complete len:103 (-),score=0.58 TRINITY_DN2197_c2_g1_i3:1366-1674(-)